eukprot:SAG31_NODE_10948_length_1079_cov_27.201020_1_plen_140_part_00
MGALCGGEGTGLLIPKLIREGEMVLCSYGNKYTWDEESMIPLQVSDTTSGSLLALDVLIADVLIADSPRAPTTRTPMPGNSCLGGSWPMTSARTTLCTFARGLAHASPLAMALREMEELDLPTRDRLVGALNRALLFDR